MSESSRQRRHRQGRRRRALAPTPDELARFNESQPLEDELALAARTTTGPDFAEVLTGHLACSCPDLLDETRVAHLSGALHAEVARWLAERDRG